MAKKNKRYKVVFEFTDIDEGSPKILGKGVFKPFTKREVRNVLDGYMSFSDVKVISMEKV